MQINGKEIDFKISRLKDAAAFEMALRAMEKREKELKLKVGKKGSSALPLFKGMIDMMRQFFVEATGIDVLKDCEDVEEAKDTYWAFLQEISNQKTKVLGITLEDIK